MVYNYRLYTGRSTYQLNKYLFVRAIVEYNEYRERLLTDFLISFAYIPGTVLHLGYGSIFEEKDGSRYSNDPFERFRESNRGIFFKASYNWRI